MEINQEKISRALVWLVRWATTGDKSGNPYSKPAVKHAIRVLQETGQCPTEWTEIFNKPSDVYFQETVEEDHKIRVRK